MDTEAFVRLQNDMNAFQRSSVLAALAELDLATIILGNENSLSAMEAARLSGCDLRGCTMLFDCLTALGYFSKHGTDSEARYSVADAYKEMLDSRHPSTCIPIIRHMACVLRKWAQLAKSVHDGIPQKGEPGILGEDEDRVSFIMGMNSIAVRMKSVVLDALKEAGVLPLAKPDARILDVGGASGTYTEAFLDMMPQATATIFDLPAGIRQATRRFAAHVMKDRVQLVEGDFTTDGLPCGFDFAWVSAIIHQMGREESQQLYVKVLDALNPGGIIAIRDFVMNEARTAPAGGTLFGINMLVQTDTGMVYTLAEIKDDLELAGFTNVRHAVDAPTMGAVVTAQKNT